MAIARSSPYKRDPTPSFFPFHPRYPASLVPPHLRISLLLHLPFFFAYPFVSLSSFQAIYSSLPRFFSCLSPFSLSPLLLPPRRVNSRRIKFEEGGGFRGEFMGLGYRFRPLLNRDCYLYTHDGTYHPLSIRTARHMRVLGFSKCFGGARGHNPPPPPPLPPPLYVLVFRRTRYERARYYTCTRDRQAQSHKRKQGLLGLAFCKRGKGGKSRHLQSGLNILRPSTSRRGGGDRRGRSLN